MSITVYDLICSSLRLAGILASGETPNAEEAQDCLTALNQMLDAWTAERTLIYEVKFSNFNLTAGKPSYTIGIDPAGSTSDFNVQRPVIIQSAAIIPGLGLEWPLDIVNSVRWASIPEKGATGVLPRSLYCDWAMPIATFYFHPVPSTASQLKMFAISPLPQFANLTDTLSLPAGYERAVRYNLAMNLSAEFPVNSLADLQLVAAIAQESKAAVKVLNAELLGNALGETTTGQIPSIPLPQPPAAPAQ